MGLNGRYLKGDRINIGDPTNSACYVLHGMYIVCAEYVPTPLYNRTANGRLLVQRGDHADLRMRTMYRLFHCFIEERTILIN